MLQATFSILTSKGEKSFLTIWKCFEFPNIWSRQQNPITHLNSYYFSDYLGFGAYLERKHPARIVKIQHQLQKPTGLIFVCLWSFFPFLPTDAICYVAGMLKINFVKFIIALAIGELILCSIYVFFYSYLLNFFQ